MTAPSSGSGARVVLRGGTVVDDRQHRSADVAVAGDRIVAVGDVPAERGDRVIDCTGRFVMPGFIDAHTHVDGLFADESVQRALLRQGVTTAITGQDGVSYAPGDGAYAAEYFAAINGPHPGYRGDGVAEILASADTRSRLNTAYLIPAGTVRHEVCGSSREPADAAQRRAMVALVEQGMREGAVGLSTGLDYVPGIFASAEELTELCGPVARAGGVYVSHMRGGYEAKSAEGIAEIIEIGRMSGAPVHVSHFHAAAEIVAAQLGALAAAGVDASFDAYPYIRGCSLLSMPILPPELSVLPVDEVVTRISDPAERARLRREWFPRVELHASLGPAWRTMITLAHVPAPGYAWSPGLTLEAAAARAGVDEIDFVLDVLAASRLEVNVVMAVRHERSTAELGRIFRLPGHMGGSDGIFIGAHPHPRARGAFARYLAEFVRGTGDWTWSEAVRHLSTAAAERFGLGRRGRIAEGWAADLIVVDPGAVADRATYDQPLDEAVGIDDVLVAGRQVLVGGELAVGTPGRALRLDRAGFPRES